MSTRVLVGWLLFYIGFLICISGILTFILSHSIDSVIYEYPSKHSNVYEIWLAVSIVLGGFFMLIGWRIGCLKRYIFQKRVGNTPKTSTESSDEPISALADIGLPKLTKTAVLWITVLGLVGITIATLTPSIFSAIASGNKDVIVMINLLFLVVLLPLFLLLTVSGILLTLLTKRAWHSAVVILWISIILIVTLPFYIYPLSLVYQDKGNYWAVVEHRTLMKENKLPTDK